MSRSRVHRRALAALAALACAGLGACGGGGSSSSQGAGGAQSSPAGGTARTIPGQIDRMPVGFFPPAVLKPVNAWRTASRTGFIEVDAGSLASNRATGVLGIFRGKAAGSKQRATLLKVLGSGRLRIVGAPLGVKAEGHAGGRSGAVKFEGTRGVQGTLRLQNDEIQLRPLRG
jgi:hypothetical protein